MKKFPIEDRNISKTIKLLPAKIKIIESDDNLQLIIDGKEK